MEVSGGALTSSNKPQDTTQQQHNGSSDGNTFPTTATQPPSQVAKQPASTITTPQQQHSRQSSATCRDEINGLLDTVLTRIVSELSLTQSTSTTQPCALKSSAEDAPTQHFSTSSPSLSPDDATCDLVIDSASNSADNQDSETQEPSSNFATLVSTTERHATGIQHDIPSNEGASGSAKNHHHTTTGAPLIVPGSVLLHTQEPLIQSTNLVPISEPQDEEEDKIKDIVTLRNLEVTPPPPIPQPPVATETSKQPATTIPPQPTIDEKPTQAETSAMKEDQSHEKPHNQPELVASNEPKSSKGTVSARKRPRTSDTTSDAAASGDMLDDSIESTSSSRSKRQRTQTKLFQVGGDVSPTYCDSPAPSAASSSKSKSSSSARKTTREKKRTSAAAPTTTTNTSLPIATPPTQSPIPKPIAQHTNDLQGVIFYEKNDYLAIRNEENSFYLCQLTENVRVTRPMIRVRWLDTKDNKNYFLTSLFDHVPQLSILMPVNLTKLKQDRKGEQLFALSNQDRDNILDRLKRSLNASAINQSSSNTTS